MTLRSRFVLSRAQSLLLRTVSRAWLVNTLIQIVLITNCVRNLSQSKTTTYVLVTLQDLNKILFTNLQTLYTEGLDRESAMQASLARQDQTFQVRLKL